MKFLKCLGLLILIMSCDDISGDMVTVLAPAESRILTVNDVNFSWNTLEGAEHYTLQIAVPSFDNTSQILFDTLIISPRFTKTLGAGDYQWRVSAENSGFKTRYITQSFTIEE